MRLRPHPPCPLATNRHFNPVLRQRSQNTGDERLPDRSISPDPMKDAIRLRATEVFQQMPLVRVVEPDWEAATETLVKNLGMRQEEILEKALGVYWIGKDVLAQGFANNLEVERDLHRLLALKQMLSTPAAQDNFCIQLDLEPNALHRGAVIQAVTQLARMIHSHLGKPKALFLSEIPQEQILNLHGAWKTWKSHNERVRNTVAGIGIGLGFAADLALHFTGIVPVHETGKAAAWIYVCVPLIIAFGFSGLTLALVNKFKKGDWIDKDLTLKDRAFLETFLALTDTLLLQHQAQAPNLPLNPDQLTGMKKRGIVRKSREALQETQGLLQRFLAGERVNPQELERAIDRLSRLQQVTQKGFREE